MMSLAVCCKVVSGWASSGIWMNFKEIVGMFEKEVVENGLREGFCFSLEVLDEEGSERLDLD